MLAALRAERVAVEDEPPDEIEGFDSDPAYINRVAVTESLPFLTEMIVFQYFLIDSRR